MICPSLSEARSLRCLAVDALRLAADFTVLVAVGAVALHLAELRLAGQQLPEGLSLANASGELEEVGCVLVGNGRVLALVLGAALLARHGPAPATRAITAVLLAVAALNAFALATAFAISAAPTLSALAVHGPLELLAFSLAAALFRRDLAGGTTPIADWAAAALVSCALLMVAAVLEVRPL